jgi:GGDEF domain-containing protein
VTHLVIVNRDITERKRMEEQLEHEAFHDSLTGLPNRNLFLDRLQRAMDHARRHPEFKFAVLFVDIQGLKIFNETMGHAVVDQLIIDISKRLKSRLRHDDTMSRSTPTGDTSGPTGGRNTGAHRWGSIHRSCSKTSKHRAIPMRVAIRIRDSLAAPFAANGVDAFTSASIGIALNSTVIRKAR